MERRKCFCALLLLALQERDGLLYKSPRSKPWGRTYARLPLPTRAHQ
jgi:hypothetical protein